MIGIARAGGKCRPAQARRGWVLEPAAADEAEQGEHDDHDQDDPENRHFRLLPAGLL
jgi:hypothetical protein